MMSLDNNIWDRDAVLWWSENSHLSLLKCINPARLDYLRHISQEELQKGLRGKAVLDIGCGGGLFSEELALQGCQVMGIDPSLHSIDMAQQHAGHMGLNTSYHVASGENIPFSDDSFDIVCCCDVLEHVSDVNSVIAEGARVLKPGGIFFYDTINRTWLSKFLMIKLLQEWEWLRIAPPNLHDWKKFIKPKELHKKLIGNGLKPYDMIGLSPKMTPLENIRRLSAIRKVKHGEISYEDLGQRMIFHASRLRSMNYMGYAKKCVR